MKICVQGLWHLGSVTAACLAYVGHDVVGLDDDLSNINNLKQGKAPLFEPGLDKMIDNAINKGHLRITKNSKDAISDAEVLWVTFDTPIDEGRCRVCFGQNQERITRNKRWCSGVDFVTSPYRNSPEVREFYKG